LIETRRATPADENALAELDLATWNWQTSPAPKPQPDSGWTFFDERTAPEDVIVAAVGGEVAGYVKLGPPTPLAASEHVQMVKGIAVSPDRQRGGVGRALMDAAVAEARARGARRLTLHVLGPNAAARRLYESTGFAVEGILRDEFFLDGAYVDDVFMALDLGDG